MASAELLLPLLLLLLFLPAAPLRLLAVGPEFITWDDLTASNLSAKNAAGGGGNASTTIVVSPDGTGDATTVQGGVDLVPGGNTERVKILISPGVYREKVTVPATKPYISFIAAGEVTITGHLKASDQDAKGNTVGTFYTATVAVEADYFCARGVRFENTAPAAAPGAVGMQAVALRLSGDKAVVCDCEVVGSQDTLLDHAGRHLFFRTLIQGSIDFISGNAKSLYQSCELKSVATSYGAVAASQRNSATEDTGFSFVDCRIDGTGMLYLGRAWGRFAKVIYANCYMEDIILPQGWSDWGDPSRASTAWFGEYNCKGPGADVTGRVPWARSLSYDEAQPFLDHSFIDGIQWLRL